MKAPLGKKEITILLIIISAGLMLGMTSTTGSNIILHLWPRPPLIVEHNGLDEEGDSVELGEPGSHVVLFDGQGCYTFRHGEYLHNACYDSMEEAQAAGDKVDKSWTESKNFENKEWKEMNHGISNLK